jgi:hypothetical protein
VLFFFVLPLAWASGRGFLFVFAGCLFFVQLVLSAPFYIYNNFAVSKKKIKRYLNIKKIKCKITNDHTFLLQELHVYIF